MAIPLLSYPPSSQNQRVAGYEIPGDEQPIIYSTENLLSAGEMDVLIRAAYRQVLNEQQLIASNRQIALESQLRAGQLTVRDFIRGLALSDPFRRRNYEPSNNYRFARMCIQRLLGRDVYNEREEMAWSIVLATKGIDGFINDLLNSKEYLENFGTDTVPYHRRRILHQRDHGEIPFVRLPRYGADHRNQLLAMGYFRPMQPTYRWTWQQPPYPEGVRLAGKVITFVGAGLLGLGAVAVALAAFGLIRL